MLCITASLLVSCSGSKQSAEEETDQCGIIAHRGFWKTEGSAQNSRKALELAIENKFYGSEFDVHLTMDNVAIIFHDHTIGDVSIQNSTYDQLKDLKTPNGETLPTLEEYLNIASGQTKTKLILEIKGHNGTIRNQEAARIIYDMIKKYKLENITEYISFDMDACKELIALNPQNKVSFLHWSPETAPTPEELKKAGFYGLDYSHVIMKEKMEWIQEAHDLRLAVNVWTVNKEEDMRLFVEAGANFITTDEPLLLEKIINEK